MTMTAVNTPFNKTNLRSALSSLLNQRSEINTQINAVKILAGDRGGRGGRSTTRAARVEKRPRTYPMEGSNGNVIREKIKEILTKVPALTVKQVRAKLVASGYQRPRGGGRLKRYEVPLAMSRMMRAGEIDRVGGSRAKGVGFQYALHTTHH